MGGGSVYSDDEEVVGIIDIDDIQIHGIGATDIAKLKANGIHTIGTLLSTTTKRLLKIKGFSDVKVEKIKEAGKKSSVSHITLSHRQVTLILSAEFEWLYNCW